MLDIPFLSNYIQKIVKEQPVADSADWLNYYCTSILLAFFSLAISAKQYFGSAIKCWTPNEFKGGWEKYAENYCFIANSYYVPFEEEVPSELEHRKDEICYYRWVPIMLAVQALLFWLPNWLWNMLHKQTAVNPRALVNEAIRSCERIGEEREKEVENLANYIADVLSVFHNRRGQKSIPRSGFNATVLYLAIKLLYVSNVIGQLILLNKFLGGKYFSWGYEQMGSMIRGEEWRESPIFPRVIMCDFEVRRLANPQRHTIQCVIMMNLINEKLYFFLYFWLMFVGITTLINFFYYLMALSVPYLRIKFVLYNINQKDIKKRGIRGRDLNRFVQRFLRPDGVLLLHFIRQHIGGRVTYDLLNELLRLFWLQECRSNDDDNTNTTKSSPVSDQTPRGGKGEDLYRANLLRRNPHVLNNDNTYKPSSYGPDSLFPQQHGYNNLRSYTSYGDWAEKRPLTAEDFIDAPSTNETMHPINNNPTLTPPLPVHQLQPSNETLANNQTATPFCNGTSPTRGNDTLNSTSNQSGKNAQTSVNSRYPPIYYRKKNTDQSQHDPTNATDNNYTSV